MLLNALLTNQPTATASYKDVRTHLKMGKTVRQALHILRSSQDVKMGSRVISIIFCDFSTQRERQTKRRTDFCYGAP